jgi:hypothetical protein
LNFAALHALPILYICENKGLSVHSPVRLRQATRLQPRIEAFGVPWFTGRPGLWDALNSRSKLPIFVEYFCERECVHVSAMEDLRE